MEAQLRVEIQQMCCEEQTEKRALEDTQAVEDSTRGWRSSVQWADSAEKAHGEELGEAAQYRQRKERGRWADVADETHSETRGRGGARWRMPRLGEGIQIEAEERELRTGWPQKGSEAGLEVAGQQQQGDQEKLERQEGREEGEGMRRWYGWKQGERKKTHNRRRNGNSKRKKRRRGGGGGE